MRRCGEIGRRKGLKIPRRWHRTGSSPVARTMKKAFAVANAFFSEICSVGTSEISSMWNICSANVKYACGVWNRCGGEALFHIHLMRSVKFHNLQSKLFHRERSERFHFLLRLNALNIGRGACQGVQKHRPIRQARPSSSLLVPKANASAFFN